MRTRKIFSLLASFLFGLSIAFLSALSSFATELEMPTFPNSPSSYIFTLLNSGDNGMSVELYTYSLESSVSQDWWRLNGILNPTASSIVNSDLSDITDAFKFRDVFSMTATNGVPVFESGRSYGFSFPGFQNMITVLNSSEQEKNKLFFNYSLSPFTATYVRAYYTLSDYDMIPMSVFVRNFNTVQGYYDLYFFTDSMLRDYFKLELVVEYSGDSAFTPVGSMSHEVQIGNHFKRYSTFRNFSYGIYRYLILSDDQKEAFSPNVPAETTPPDDPNPPTSSTQVVVDMSETNGILGSLKTGFSNFVDSWSSGFSSIISKVSAIGEAITNLPQLLLDGIKNLFVPSEQDLLDFKADVNTLLEDTFGGLYEAETLIHQAMDTFDSVTAMETISFPGIELAFDMWQFSVPSMDVPLKPSGFEFLYLALAKIVDIVALLAFINMLHSKFEEIIHGKVVVEIAD